MTTTPQRTVSTSELEWIAKLDGIDTDHPRRALQIALAAIDRIISAGRYETEDEPALYAAYDALQEALALEDQTGRV